MFNQHKNFQEAILKKRARVEEINLILNRPLPKGASHSGRLRLVEEKLHLEKAIAELEAEDVRLLAQQKAQHRIFKWEDLDQRLVTPKTSDLANEMHKRIADAERRISFECGQRKNMYGYLPGLTDFHEGLTNEWADRLYEAYCEAWRQQGEKVSPAFIRAVRDRAVQTLFSARESAVSHGFENWSRRTGGLYFNPHVLSNWKMKMMRLRDRWNGKLEAEAVAAEYAAKHVQQNPKPAQTSTTSSVRRTGQAGIWNELHDEFIKLLQEEQQTAPKNIGDKWLFVHISYESSDAKFGQFWLCRGIGESFRSRFEAVATRAGITINAKGQEARPLNIWIHHVYQDLLLNKSDLLRGATEKGAIIDRVCEASAICCSRLEMKSLEADLQKPEARNGGPSASGKGNAGRPAQRPPEFVTFVRQLWTVETGKAKRRRLSDDDLKTIALQLDSSGFTPPSDFLEAQYADELKEFNSRHANSKTRPIKTWVQLVTHGDKDHLRGMKKLLSRYTRS